MSKVEKIKQKIERLKKQIREEEAKRPGYTSPKRAELFYQEDELRFYSQYEK